MNAVLFETLRRQWPIAGALAIFVVFALTHTVAFEPMAKRYEAALKIAGEAALDPASMAPMVPPRVFALLSDHALAPSEAQDRAASGALTASLLEDLNRMASARGLSVLSTEPGPVTQVPQSVVVRAHLRMRGDFGAWTGLLADIARGKSLLAIDRFVLQAADSEHPTIEVWASREVLKQAPITP